MNKNALYKNQHYIFKDVVLSLSPSPSLSLSQKIIQKHLAKYCKGIKASDYKNFKVSTFNK